METVQPIYVDKNGTKRFLSNEIVDDITDKKLNEIAMYRYKHKNIHLDDFRQFNQLIGYSVCGYLSLSYCYREGTIDSFYDEDYADYIENIMVSNVLIHPEQHIIEGDKSPDFFRPNLVLVTFVKEFKINVEKYFSSDNYKKSDKRQFAQLLGYSVDEVNRRFA